nr:unnamed protein product [Digitaria exilis]
MDCCRHVNPFRACAGLRGLGYLMVALVAAIAAVSYYAVVLYAWGPVLLSGGASAAGAAAVLAAFHVLIVGILVPLQRTKEVLLDIALVVKMANLPAVIIALSVYTFAETVLDTLVLLPNFIEFFQDGSLRSSSPGDIAILFLAFVLNLAFALSLLCFIGMHTSLVTSNTTSIEVHERRKSVSWKYDVGWKRNLEQVFGTKKLFWFVPLYSTEDLHNIPALRGLEFPTRSDTIV